MKIFNTKNLSKFILIIVWALILTVTVFTQHEHMREVLDSSGLIVVSDEGVCFRYNPFLAWNLGITDFIIFLCYFFIPLGMYQSLNSLPRGLAKPLRNYSILLGIFIVTCGLTHLMNVFLLFVPIWYTAVVVNYICAISSVIAAFYLWFYARVTLNNIANNLKDLLSVKDSINKLNELERILDKEPHNSLTVTSIKSQINLIRMNLSTLESFQESIQK